MALARRYGARVKSLAAVILFLEKAGTYIRYERKPTPEIIRVLSVDPGLKELEFLKDCAERIKRGIPFPEAWEESLSICSAPFDPEEKNTLKGLGGDFGKNDAQGQLEIIALHSTFFDKALEGARECERTQGKLCRNLGILGGLCVAILLL